MNSSHNKTNVYRCIMITDFNIDNLELYKTNEHIQYGVIGSEICPSSGRPHLQGYLELVKQSRLAKLKKVLPPGVHIESRRGTQKQAIQYCQKDSNWIDWGLKKMMGKRPDRGNLREFVRDGRPLRDINAEYDLSFTDIKYYEKQQMIQRPPLCIYKPHVTWYCGNSGTGKTTAALAEAGPFAYDKAIKDRWWTGFDNEECILLNEWRPSEYFDASTTLKLLGGEPMLLETKGGHTHYRGVKRIILTTIQRPEEIWAKYHSDEQIKQLLRRIDVIKVCHISQSSGNTGPRFVIDTEYPNA